MMPLTALCEDLKSNTELVLLFQRQGWYPKIYKGQKEDGSKLLFATEGLRISRSHSMVNLPRDVTRVSAVTGRLVS